MMHDTSILTISQAEASHVEETAKRRLLGARKLSLVVDLDQTIIHATVDPTVEMWQGDKDNPNYNALRDVRKFELIDEVPGQRKKGCWYYIKLRPGLIEFLDHIAKMFECHVYTMGTRAYAQNIANIVDPDRKIFGDRILSRDESGSLTAKNLARLFPVDTKMVVIIDDRGDVWKWSNNLIKVIPYDFFVGIGDINSSFLPKRQELPSTDSNLEKANAEVAINPDKAPENAPTNEDSIAKTNGASSHDSTSSGDASTLEQLVTMGGGDDPLVLQAQANKQEETIAAQVEDRPLLQMQKQLDKEDEAAAAAEASSNGTDSSDNDDVAANSTPDAILPATRRHHLLEDNDTELYHLEERLRTIHHNFFDEYDRKRAGSKGGRISALRGERKVPASSDSLDDLHLVPDVKIVMPAMKMRVLQGVVVVLSGVLPLGTDIHTADISLWAKSFGANIVNNVGRKVTHVVAARNRTQKVRQAAKRGGIKVVTTQWLVDCIQQWQHLDEEPYLIPLHPEDKAKGDAQYRKAQVEEQRMSLMSSSDEETGAETDEESTTAGGKKSLRISTDSLTDREDEATQRSDASPRELKKSEWDEMDDEMRDFLGGESVSESENDSEGDDGGSDKKRKRRSASESEKDSDSEDSEAAGGGSKLEKKIKRVHERETTLRNVATLRSRDSSPFAALNGDEGQAQADDEPDPTGDVDLDPSMEEKAEIAEEMGGGDSDADGESGDELAKEMEREFGSAEDEDEDEAGSHGTSAAVFDG